MADGGGATLPVFKPDEEEEKLVLQLQELISPISPNSPGLLKVPTDTELREWLDALRKKPNAQKNTQALQEFLLKLVKNKLGRTKYIIDNAKLNQQRQQVCIGCLGYHGEAMIAGYDETDLDSALPWHLIAEPPGEPIDQIYLKTENLRKFKVATLKYAKILEDIQKANSFFYNRMHLFRWYVEIQKRLAETPGGATGADAAARAAADALLPSVSSLRL